MRGGSLVAAAHAGPRRGRAAIAVVRAVVAPAVTAAVTPTLTLTLTLLLRGGRRRGSLRLLRGLSAAPIVAVVAAAVAASATTTTTTTVATPALRAIRRRLVRPDGRVLLRSTLLALAPGTLALVTWTLALIALITREANVGEGLTRLARGALRLVRERLLRRRRTRLRRRLRGGGSAGRVGQAITRAARATDPIAATTAAAALLRHRDLGVALRHSDERRVTAGHVRQRLALDAFGERLPFGHLSVEHVGHEKPAVGGLGLRRAGHLGALLVGLARTIGRDRCGLHVVRGLGGEVGGGGLRGGEIGRFVGVDVVPVVTLVGRGIGGVTIVVRDGRSRLVAARVVVLVAGGGVRERLVAAVVTRFVVAVGGCEGGFVPFAAIAFGLGVGAVFFRVVAAVSFAGGGHVARSLGGLERRHQRCVLVLLAERVDRPAIFDRRCGGLLVVGRSCLSLLLGAAPMALQVRLEVVGANQVLDVEERRALQPHVDERCLHTGQDAAHFAEVNVSERPLGALALQVKLGDDSVFNQRDPRFADVDVDDQNVPSHVVRAARLGGGGEGRCVLRGPSSPGLVEQARKFRARARRSVEVAPQPSQPEPRSATPRAQVEPVKRVITKGPAALARRKILSIDAVSRRFFPRWRPRGPPPPPRARRGCHGGQAGEGAQEVLH